MLLFQIPLREYLIFILSNRMQRGTKCQSESPVAEYLRKDESRSNSEIQVSELNFKSSTVKIFSPEDWRLLCVSGCPAHPILLDLLILKYFKAHSHRLFIFVLLNLFVSHYLLWSIQNFVTYCNFS